MSKICSYKNCTRGTYSDVCFIHRKRKRISRYGKAAKLWRSVREKWIATHPEPWNCYICAVRLDSDTLTLDHVIPRSNAKNYANRHDDTNIRPACFRCNSEKGSKHVDNI